MLNLFTQIYKHSLGNFRINNVGKTSFFFIKFLNDFSGSCVYRKCLIDYLCSFDQFLVKTDMFMSLHLKVCGKEFFLTELQTFSFKVLQV